MRKTQHSPSGTTLHKGGSSGKIGNNSADKERKNSSNQQANVASTWVEEQKAHVADTYLRPFKLMKTGEVVQKPQAKTIK